jgi:bifunctional DNase/RNase
MELLGVRVELPSNSPIVLLRETGGERRVLPIYIGGPEATAIAFALEQVATPRPMTHDLLKNVLDELGARVQRILVTELRDHTFFAELELNLGGRVHRVSSRPSDAIALAVRSGTPIFADESVLEEAGQTPGADDDDDPEELVEHFKQFIDEVNPEDFAS